MQISRSQVHVWCRSMNGVVINSANYSVSPSFCIQTYCSSQSVSMQGIFFILLNLYCAGDLLIYCLLFISYRQAHINCLSCTMNDNRKWDSCDWLLFLSKQHPITSNIVAYSHQWTLQIFELFKSLLFQQHHITYIIFHLFTSKVLFGASIWEVLGLVGLLTFTTAISEVNTLCSYSNLSCYKCTEKYTEKNWMDPFKALLLFTG